MSFGNHARRVRDPALPFRWRVSALRSCVQLYRPLGFRATLGYLEAEAGRFQREEGEIDPNVQARFYWYGAPREAALFALWFWRERRPSELMPAELVECVEECLRATAGQRDALVGRIREVESRLQSWELLQVVRHVEVALGLWTDSGLIETGAVAIS